MSRGTVISLADLTGNFVRPWVDAGYDAILVDPQHVDSVKFERTDGGWIRRWPLTITEALGQLSAWMDDVVFVAGFPPCTDMSVSGARWFESKRAADPMFQAKAVAVAEQCRTIGAIGGAPYLVENPVSVLSRVFGPADHWFHPYFYSGYEASENYTKRTQLWTGNGFVMPEPFIDTTLGEPDDRIHKAPPGPERGNFRSATPMGFARAVFQANAEAARAAA